MLFGLGKKKMYKSPTLAYIVEFISGAREVQQITIKRAYQLATQPQIKSVYRQQDGKQVDWRVQG